MTIYLTIIITVLVLTQIIWLLQNYKQLKSLEKAVDYIINKIQVESDSSMSGFQGYVTKLEIIKLFGINVIRKIESALNNREEIADVVEDAEGFDVVLYTAYAPNYDSKE